MKLSGDEFFSALETGLKGGVLGTDKIADAFKEFNIRIIDGSKTTHTALGDLGISVKQLEEGLANGELSKGDAFKLIKDKLSEVDDQVKQNAIGVSLFGTQWEDLGGKAILSVDLQKTALADVEGATKSLDVQYNDLGSAITGVGRQVQVAILPIGDAILNVVNRAMPYISSLASAIGVIGSKFNSLPAPIRDTVTAIGLLTAAIATGITVWAAVSPVFVGMGASLTALKTTLLGFAATVRTTGVSIGASISAAIWPITLVVAAVAGLYLAYRTNFLGIRDFLKPVIANIVAIVGKVVEGIRYVVYNADTLWKAFLKSAQITATTLGSIVKGIGTILGGVGLILYAAFIQPWAPVFQALQTAGAGVVNGLTAMVNGIANVLRPVFGLLQKLGIGVGQALEQAVGNISSRIVGLFGGAASQLQAQAEAAAKNNSTFGKGLDQVKAGWNDVTGAVNTASAAYRGLAASTQAALKTPPRVQVTNAALPVPPKTPTVPTPKPTPTPNTASNPYLNRLANSGADPEPAKPASKPKTTKASTGTGKDKDKDSSSSKADEPYKATTRDVSELSKAITRLMEDQKRLVATGKLTQDQSISYKRNVEDLATRIDDLNLENNKQIQGLYSQAKAYISTSTQAAKSIEAKRAEVKASKDAAAQAKQEAAQAKSRAEAQKREAEARTKNISTATTALTRLIQDQKKLVSSGKVTEDQVTSYKRKVEDLTKSINGQGIASNATIKDLLNQAKAYISTSNASAIATTARAKAEAERKKQEEERKKAEQAAQKEADKLKQSVKDMTDEELSSTIKRLDGRNKLGDKQKLAILNTELEARAQKQLAEENERLAKALEEYLEVQVKVNEAISDYNSTAADLNLEAVQTSLETKMQAEIDAANNSEAAILDIKRKYAPQFLQLEIDKLTADSQAKAAALEKDYHAQIEEANRVGADTTALEAAYLSARTALNASTTASINAARSKSARDIAEEEKALDKEVAEFRVQVNKEAAKSIVEAATSGIDSSSLTSLLDARDTLTALIPTVAGLDASALADLNTAIADIDKGIAGIKDTAAKSVGEVIASTSDLATEFDKLGKTLSPKDKYVQDGISAYDALITKYDEALARLKQLRDVFERTGDTAGLTLLDTITANTTADRSGVVGARNNALLDAGAKYDKDKATESAKLDTELANREKVLIADVSAFKLNSLETEKNAKLALAKTDEEKKQIELAYVERIKQANLQAIQDKETAALAAIESEKQAELSKEGLTQGQTDKIHSFYATKAQLVKDGYQLERDEIDRTSKKADEANTKLLTNWEELLKRFLTDMANAIGSAYATIYKNNQALAEATYNTPEEKQKAQEDTAKANADASTSAGVAMFSSAVNILATIFPQFAYGIELIGGFLAKMPQLGIVFQRIGEIFLVLMDAVTPLIGLLATVLEPLLNIFKVMLEAIIKPLLPIITFFVNVVGGIIKAVYGIVKTVWNAIAGFLNSINIFGWKPFNLSMLPELNTDAPGTPAVNTPSTPSTGTTSPTTDTTSNGSITTNNKTEIVINVTGGTDPNEVARLVERKLMKALR